MSGAGLWSRRKAAVAEEARAEAAALEAQEVEAREAALSERSDEDILAEHGLPEPETLDSAEAVRDFMANALPQRLKTRALRQLWKLNPVLANLDGLVDYGEDFTDSATVIENLQTAYQVGKGMLSHIEAMAAEAEAEDAEAVEIAAEPDEEVPAPIVVEDPAPEAIGVVEALPAPEETAALAVLPRRMQFRFEEPV